MMIPIHFRHLAAAAYIYLLLPIVVFLTMWTRWYIGFPAALALVFAAYVASRRTADRTDEPVRFAPVPFILTLLALGLWCWTSSIGCTFVSSIDDPWRIAIFRDLVDYSWPVVYDSGHSLSYYHFFWLVPALVGHLFGWFAGNAALFLWAYLGVVISYLLIASILRMTSTSKLWVLCLLFAGWGGLNLLGAMAVQVLGYNPSAVRMVSMEDWLHPLYNGHSFNFLFRSNDDALHHIFNQMPPLWVAVPLLFHQFEQRRIDNSALLFIAVFPYAPFPFLGLIPIVAAMGISYLVANRRSGIRPILQSVFSVPNLTALLLVFPIVAMYFQTNSNSAKASWLPLESFDRARVVSYVIFCVVEFGIVSALIAHKNRRNWLFYVLVACMVLAPLIEYGGGRDFCMNAPLPALFFLFILVMKHVHDMPAVITWRSIALVLSLFVMWLSMAFAVAHKLVIIASSDRFPVINDQVRTLEGRQYAEHANFLAEKPRKTRFFKYLSRTPASELPMVKKPK